MKMLFKKLDIFQFFGKTKSLLMAKLVEPTALLGLDFTSFLIFFGHIVTVWDCLSKHDGDG